MTNSQIADVNHWRGRCLDDLARVEQAVIKLVERWQKASPATAPTLAETASARSQNLANSLQKLGSKDPKAAKLIKLLGLWKHREKDRNDLVHGLFTVKTNADGWLIVNRTVAVKKQVATIREVMISEAQAETFRLAVTSERKELEAAMNAIAIFS